MNRSRSPSNEDRTYDLSTIDPHVRCSRSGRAPPSRARRCRSREEEGAALRRKVEFRSNGEERGGAALRQKNKLVCLWGCPSSSIYSGRGGEATLEEGGSPRGSPMVSLHLVGRQGRGRKL